MNTVKKWFKKCLTRLIPIVMIFILIIGVASLALNIVGRMWNERLIDSWRNERRFDRSISYYFDHMENGRDFVDRFGNLMTYPYDLPEGHFFGFRNLTDFVGIEHRDWLTVFIIRPGTTREEILDIPLGSRTVARPGEAPISRIRGGANLPDVVREGYTQILFLGYGGVIICNIHSPYKDYEFDVGEFYGNHIRFSQYTDQVSVSMSRSEETGCIVARLERVG
jgi:hypothetical protein